MTIRFRCALISAALLLSTQAFGQTVPSEASPAAPVPAATPAPLTPQPDQPTVPAAAPSTITPSAVAPSAAPTPSAAPAPAPVVAGVINAPPASKGQIVFFRPFALGGMAVWFNVRENGALLGKLSNGVYFVQVTDPGTHIYLGATENKDTIKLEVDDGETYFVKGSISMGMLIGEANLTPSDQATFEKALKSMKLAKPVTPEATPSTSAETAKPSN
jgi:hypothetical protein